MANTREDILDDLATALGSVGTVTRWVNTWSEVGASSRPRIGIAPGRETWEYHPSNLIRVTFAVTLFCHVTGASVGARATAANNLIDAIAVAVFTDPTRGGNAVISRITSTETDELVDGSKAGLTGVTVRVDLEFVYNRTKSATP